MTSLIRHFTIDSTDAYRLAGFWSAVLDAPLGEDDGLGDPEVSVEAEGVALLFVTVPEPKPAGIKNRLHLDLQPQDRTRDAEVERLLTLGATQVADLRRPDGTGWVVLSDIEGNEFCVERSAAERTA